MCTGHSNVSRRASAPIGSARNAALKDSVCAVEMLLIRVALFIRYPSQRLLPNLIRGDKWSGNFGFAVGLDKENRLSTDTVHGEPIGNQQ